MDVDTRLFTVEQDIKNIFDRLGKTENKAAGAWKAVIDTNADVADLRTEVKDLRKQVNEVKQDVKEIKLNMQTMFKLMKFIGFGVLFLGVVILVAALVATFKGSDVPEKTLELMIPAMQKLIG